MQTPISSQPLDNAVKVTYSREDVSKHSQEGDIWVIIENDVYDLSLFLQEHPGGAKSKSAEKNTVIWITKSHIVDSFTRGSRPRRNQEVQKVSSPRYIEPV
jgi:cytochrome b involved in lipid metabolism